MNNPTSNFQLPTSKRDLAALALIAALVLVFFWRILTPRELDRAAFPPGDFTDQFWMFRVETARAFAQGRLPLWSDYFNSGHPFLADVQSAIFYPISLVWTLAVVAVRGENFSLFALELEAIFHFILAGAFTYLFARRVLESRLAALVSALTFTFGGYLTSYPPQQLAILETATWLPLALLFLDCVIARSEATKQSPPGQLGIASQQSLAMTGAGITLGIAALAGHPQTFLFVIYAGAIFYFWRVAQIPNPNDTNYELRITNYELRFHASRFIAIILIAAGLSAAQWIPSLEYQLVSTRAALDWAEAARGFSTVDPLQMILPGFTSAFQSPLYIGILPLWLAMFALFTRRARAIKFWALLAVGALIVSFGFYAFGYALLYLFAPGFAIFRGQERLALVVSFALAILAGFGMREMLQRDVDRRALRRAWALLPMGITISVMFVITLFVSGTVRQSGRVAFLGDRAGLMVLLFTLATALIAARWRARAWRAFAGLALALIAFDLFSVGNAAYNATTIPRFPANEIARALQNDPGIFRVADENQLPGHFGIAYRVEEIGGISPLRIARYDRLRELPEEKLYPLLNVRYLITARPGFENAEIIAEQDKTRVLRLNDPMPRAWFAPFVLVNANDQQVLDVLAQNSTDFWYLAFLAEPPAFPLPAPPVLQPPEKTAYAAEFQRITPEHARVIVNASADGAVVLSENYFYPGWRAFVDGVETKIARANVALSAVPVRAGARQIEFIFDPWSVKIGIAISALTILALIAWRVRR